MQQQIKGYPFHVIASDLFDKLNFSVKYEASGNSHVLKLSSGRSTVIKNKSQSGREHNDDPSPVDATKAQPGNRSGENKFSYSEYLFTFAPDKIKMTPNTHIHHHHLAHGVSCDGIM